MVSRYPLVVSAVLALAGSAHAQAEAPPLSDAERTRVERFLAGELEDLAGLQLPFVEGRFAGPHKTEITWQTRAREDVTRMQARIRTIQRGEDEDHDPRRYEIAGVLPLRGLPADAPLAKLANGRRVVVVELQHHWALDLVLDAEGQLVGLIEGHASTSRIADQLLEALLAGTPLPEISKPCRRRMALPLLVARAADPEGKPAWESWDEAAPWADLVADTEQAPSATRFLAAPVPELVERLPAGGWQVDAGPWTWTFDRVWHLVAVSPKPGAPPPEGE